MFQALIETENKYRVMISPSFDANFIPSLLSNVEEDVIACQSSDAVFCWDRMQWIWKCHV